MYRKCTRQIETLESRAVLNGDFGGALLDIGVGIHVHASANLTTAAEVAQLPAATYQPADSASGGSFVDAEYFYKRFGRYASPEPDG